MLNTYDHQEDNDFKWSICSIKYQLCNYGPAQKGEKQNYVVCISQEYFSLFMLELSYYQETLILEKKITNNKPSNISLSSSLPLFCVYLCGCQIGKDTDQHAKWPEI